MSKLSLLSFISLSLTPLSLSSLFFFFLLLSFYFFPDFALQAAIHACASFLRASGVSAPEEEGGAAAAAAGGAEEEGAVVVGVWSCFCVAASPAKAAASAAATGV